MRWVRRWEEDEGEGREEAEVEEVMRAVIVGRMVVVSPSMRVMVRVCLKSI